MHEKKNILNDVKFGLILGPVFLLLIVRFVLFSLCSFSFIQLAPVMVNFSQSCCHYLDEPYLVFKVLPIIKFGLFMWHQIPEKAHPKTFYNQVECIGGGIDITFIKCIPV